MKTTRFHISGMSCGHCIHAVREALTALPGVRVDEVGIGSAVVSHEEELVSVGALVDAIGDAGYEATERI
ncbi:MAG: heavy-metal-associated domain-containing protein [Gemmatimonadaceae bacterium]|nr:heavy-metal-associated domain-containing protein [Gemmatimonadaceae bacterium]